eukprot:1161540-Pelagomonas_calceolata.AAC.31
MSDTRKSTSVLPHDVQRSRGQDYSKKGLRGHVWYVHDIVLLICHDGMLCTPILSVPCHVCINDCIAMQESNRPCSLKRAHASTRYLSSAV